MRRPRRSKEEMFPLVEAYLESRQTVKDFSREHEVAQSVFTYWLTKYRRESASSLGFIEITSPSPLDNGQPLVELVYPSVVRLRLFSPVAPSYLAALVAHAAGGA